MLRGFGMMLATNGQPKGDSMQCYMICFGQVSKHVLMII